MCVWESVTQIERASEKEKKLNNAVPVGRRMLRSSDP